MSRIAEQSCAAQALTFVRAEHLDIPAGHRDHTAWLLAMKELHKLNNYKVQQTCDRWYTGLATVHAHFPLTRSNTSG